MGVINNLHCTRLVSLHPRYMDKSGDLWARYVQLGNCPTLFALAFTFAFVLFETSKASFWLFPRCFRDIRLGTWGLKCVNNAIFDIMYFHSRHFFKTYLALNPFWLHQFISSFFNFFLCNNKKILSLPKNYSFHIIVIMR